MKHSIRYWTFFLCLLVFLSVLLGLPAGAQAETENHRQERLQELFELYSRYRAKEDDALHETHPTSDMLWDDYLTPLTKLTGNDANNEALIDLIYHKGAALAPLSWIYHSHSDVNQSETVAQVYQQQSVLIRSKTSESDDRIAFFEGLGGENPTVYACYTALLNEIYTQKLQALALPSDSPAANRILSDAIQRLQNPQSVAPDPSNPTPAFTRPEDEDAACYEEYLSTVKAQLAQQRDRDFLRRQLDTVYRVLYPTAEFTELEELVSVHDAVYRFLDELPRATTAVQMNTLLGTAVGELLDELADGAPTYTKQYFQVTLKAEVNDTVALASGAIPSPKLVTLAELCFGDAYQLKLSIAQSKDLLIAEAQRFENLPEDRQALLNAILNDYTDSRLDACATTQALTEEMARARLRLDWFEQYERLLPSVEAALNKYGASVANADRDGILTRAAAQYEQTDQAIRDGLRTAPSDPLAEDLTAMAQILRDAEILSYLAKHPVVATPPASITRQDRERLAAAIKDSDTLTDAAKNEDAFNKLLLALGAHYKTATQDEIAALLSGFEQTGDDYEILRRRLAHSSDALQQAVDALLCADENGRLDLPTLMARADALAQKAAYIRALATYYGEQILAYAPVYYVDLMHQVFANAADDIRRVDNHTEQAVSANAMAQLDRLLVLHRLRQSSQPYQQIPGVQALLQEAEEALLPEASAPPDDLSAYQSRLLSRIRDCVRADFAKRLEDAYNSLMERKDDYSEKNLSRLYELYTLALAEIQSYLLSDGDANALLERTEAHITAMRKIRLDRVQASDSSEYRGTAEAENGFSTDATLLITASSHSPETVAKQIHLAAKENRIRPVGGTTLSEALRSRLKRCTVTAALDIQLYNPDSATDLRYKLSVPFSESTDLSHVLGIIYISEDGSMEFYEMTIRDFLVQFTTSHASDYYIVSERVVNLMPWIILLSILLTGELVVLVLLYLRRNRRYSANTALSLFLPSAALRVAYRPAGGVTAIVVLSIAAVGLGIWIAALLLAERRAAKKSAKLPALEAPVAAAVPCLEATPSTPSFPTIPERAALMAPLPEVTAEDAELLMSDEEATELRQTEYTDEEQYSGARRAQINLDTISHHFEEGEIVHLNILKEKKLLPKNVGFVKILARGTLDKPLTILAQDFSTAALKMILLTGGIPIVTHASPEREKRSRKRL